MTAFEKIYEVLKRIPRGKVATYGQIAEYAGNMTWTRAIPYALHANPDPEKIPCHRVVNRFGELCTPYVFGGAEYQARLLRSEGVEVSEDNKVDLSVYLWDGQ